MKNQHISLIFLTVFLLSLSNLICAQIPNPSFEEWYYNDEQQRWLPVDWEFDATSNYSQSNDAVDGLSSARKDSDGSSWMTLTGEWSDTEFIEPFYSISYWSKISGFQELWFTHLGLQVTLKDKMGRFYLADINENRQINAGGWQKFSYSINYDSTPQDSIISWSISILIEGGGTGGTGTIWVDHVQISNTPIQTAFIKPKLGNLFLAGKKDTIKWDIGTAGQKAKLWYSPNEGTNYVLLADNIPADTGIYIWDVPDTLLTAKAKVKLTDQNTGDILAESDNFLIKPYLLTRMESNGELTGYNIWSDPWGFKNDSSDVWPDWYYNQFNYNGTDEYTGQLYDHIQGDSVFFTANQEDYPGWKNYVETFSVGSCYDDMSTALYNQKALLNWKKDKREFFGACFGIAASNALAFESKDDFLIHFPDFGTFIQPVFVTPTMGTVESVINLFAHQFGDPSIYNDVAGNGLKTPTETVEDIKKMFSTSHTEIRTLTMFNNSGSGGHTILPYKLIQDTINDQYWYIYVYDNSNPDSINARIRVDVSANGGAGKWQPLHDWSGWGGDKKLYLEIPSTYYYVNATLKKGTRSSSFLDSLIDVSANDGADIRIVDGNGLICGFENGQVFEEIPESHALMLKNGSESPPYRYFIPQGEYTINIANPVNNMAEGYIFTKDQLFYYERKNVTPQQTDQLFFDGALTTVNSDNEAKNIKVMLLLEQEEQEKVFKINSFQLDANDSVKVESPDNNHVILYNYGSAKNYTVELNSVSASGFERFVNDQVPVGQNTMHQFDINWTNVDESVLYVYVDEGMDGSNEDTLRLNYHVTGIDELKDNSLIAGLDLQVWPNPVIDKLNVSYYLERGSKVSLKIYDNYGKEVMIPLSFTQQAPGKHFVPVDMSNLPTGVYYYKLIINTQPDFGKIIKL